MRKFFVFLALVGSSPCWAAISYTALLSASCTASSSTGTACTLTTPNTAGSDVVVGLSWKSTSRSLSKVVGNVPSARFFIYAQQMSGTSNASAIVVCRDCAALTSITPTFSGSTDYVLNAAQYSGVAWMGVTQVCPLLNGSAGTCAANAGTQPGITITTGDANDWLVTETASPGSGGAPKANTGSLRLAGSSGTGSGSVAGGLIDNTAASAGSLSASDTIASGAWTAAGLELRTTAPQTYIWPDCDQTHPCLIHHKATVGLGASSDTLTSPFYVRVQPSLANNLLVFVATYPSADTFTMSDNNGNTWATGASTVDSGDGTATVVKYLCGAGAGVSTIQPSFSGTISSNDIVQFSYYEISGIAASACGDGGSAANGISGTMNPGNYATSSSGDLLLTFAIDAENSENNYQSGWAMGDDLSALVYENPFDNFLSTISVQAAASSSTNPTMYGNAMDLGSQDPRWNIVSQAFIASSGAGTQPPAGQAWVVREGMFHSSPASTMSWMPFPTSGNAIVVESSNAESDNNISGINDNQDSTFVVNPMPDTTEDPQQYAVCLGTATTSKDRGIAWPSGDYPVPLDFYDIAGAKNATGNGCIGSESNHHEAMQAAITNSNIVGDTTISPTLNGSATSVVVTTSYFGQGPPQGPCISGGVTPPVCTGDMTPFVFASVWASGMSDGSHWDNGDPYGYWYTNSTSPFSVDYLMANGTGGGSVYDGAAIEILGQPAPANPLESFAVAPANVTIATGATQQYTATGTYLDGTLQDISSLVTWSSSGSAVTISSAGLATAPCAGSTTITAKMLGLSNSTGLTVTGLAASTIVVSPSTNPSPPGQSVTFTAAVTSLCGTPTGTVQFVIDGANYGSPVTLSNGMASTSATLPSGSHSVAGMYSGDATFAGSMSSGLSQTVNTSTPILLVTNSPAVYNGNPQAAAVSGSVAGIVSNVLYSGSAIVPTSAGSYAITANFAPTDTTDYVSLTGASAGNFVISPATPGLTVTNSPVVYNGNPQIATVSSSVTGTVSNVLYSGSANAPTAAGTYAITANFAPSDATDYMPLTGAAAGSFVIKQVTPTLAVVNSPVPYSGSAQAVTISSSVPGTVTNVLYSGSATVPAKAGTYAITANFTPSDTTDYTTLTAAPVGSFVITKVTPALSITNSPVTYNGSARTATVKGSVAGTVSNVLYSGSATAPTTAGTYAITANFTPTDTTDYNSLTAASAGSFVIVQATPTLTVTNSPATYNGNPLVANISSSVPGTVSNVLYSGSATLPTAAGTYAITANFTPTDTTDYTSLNGASARNFVINVVTTTPTLAVTNSPVTYNGSPQGAVVGSSVPGTVSNVKYSGSTTVPTKAGTYAITANFTPTDTVDYKSLTGASAGNFVINKATPTLSVTNSPVTYNANARTATVTGSVAGKASSVLYGGSATAPTAAGTYAITANFAPTDTTDYNSLTGASAGNFVINKATPTLKVTNSPVKYNGAAQTATISGSVAGTVSAILYAGSSTAPTVVGTYAVAASFTPTDATDYNSLTAASAGNFVINKATPTVTLASSLNPSTSGTTVTFTATLPPTATGTVTFKSGTTTQGTSTISGGIATYSTSKLAMGKDSITASYGGDGNYNSATSAILTQTVH